MSVAGFFAAVIGGAIVLICSVTLVIMTGVYYVDKSSCHSFGRESNREVRFVKFNFFEWDCLTPTANGKWISTDRLREID